VQVDPEHPVPVVERGVLDRLEEVDPGVVEQQADRAELGLDLVGRGLNPSRSITFS
jgi:hypothetical protein